MKEKELILPDDWEVKKVEGNKIILGEKEMKLPKTWNECVCNSNMEHTTITVSLPKENEGAVRALCKLLSCRNAWWERLGWKPDWDDQNQRKYCIGLIKGKVETTTNEGSNRILAFPSEEVRYQFLDSFRDLIEEAKELL